MATDKSQHGFVDFEHLGNFSRQHASLDSQKIEPGADGPCSSAGQLTIALGALFILDGFDSVRVRRDSAWQQRAGRVIGAFWWERAVREVPCLKITIVTTPCPTGNRMLTLTRS